jgi:ABC-type uncharacterized transport system substrate-binding protein
MWNPVIAEMKQQQSQIPDIEIVGYDIIATYGEFKQKVLDYQNKVDAIGFLGVFNFKNDTGKNVLLGDIAKWLDENNKLPDFSFWEDRVVKGTLCAVAVSGYEQGYLAGKLARKILVDGKSPAEFTITSTEKGIPIINLATAKKLNITPSDDILSIAKTIKEIEFK